MSGEYEVWQRVTADVPSIGDRVWVAYHGHGEVRVAIVTRIRNKMEWGDWDYINSHDGEPKYWAPLIVPPTPPDDIPGPECGCDGCTEQYSEEEWP